MPDVTEKIEALQKDITRILELLLGNGKLGVIGRIFAAEKSIESIQKDIGLARNRAWQIFMRVMPWAGITAAASYITHILSQVPTS